MRTLPIGLGALAERPFRLFWIGRTTSAFGDAFMPVAVAFAVLSISGSAGDIGLVLATSTAVRMLLLVFGGAIADRVPRRLLLVGSDTFLLVVQTTMGVLLLLGHRSVAALLVAAVCYGAASALSKPAIVGLVPQTVGPGRLQQANALMDLSRGVAQVLGPAVAGLAIALTSPGWVYLLDAATFLVSMLTLVSLRLPPAKPRMKAGLINDIRVGWHEVTSRTWYWVALCGHALWNLGACSFLVLGPVIVLRETGAATGWGVVTAGVAAGSLLGAAAALRLRPRRPLLIAHLALLLTVFQLASLLDPAPIVVIACASAVAAAGVGFVNNVWTTVVQRLIPDDVLSRVNSYDWLVSFAVAPLGYAAAGPLSEAVGTVPTLLVALGLVVFGVIVVLLVPEVVRLRQDRDGRLSGWTAPEPEPQPAAAAGPGSG
jgi:MFS family permease